VLIDPKDWRDRAEELRLLAQDMKDAESKTTMLRIAQDYDRLATFLVMDHILVSIGSLVRQACVKFARAR
jgi:hypothetical protein